MKYTLDWNEYLRTAAQAAAEGIVMLRNESEALPLPAGGEIAVFGRIQLHYYKSGTGSGGMVNVSKVTGILDGLLDAGVRVNQKLLDVYRAWDAENPFDPGKGWGGEPWAQAEMPLEESLVAETAAVCQRAVVIIGRTAGEEMDNRDAEGSWRLTSAEENMLRLTRKYFAKVIVLLNTGNIIDMSFLDKHHPDAVLLVWQGGMTGGTGAADVLTGKVSPSGKLPDTIAYALSDYPSDAHFGDQNANCYAEDIYVGYRWFETFAPDRVRYPFGFGLSYTTFSLTTDALRTVRGEQYLPVTVRNTGAYAGKEVVQIYCEAPQGKLGKPRRVLTAFYKTKELAPDESETVCLSLPLPPSYDDSGVTGHAHAWVLEAGTYRFYAGTDVRSAALAAEIPLDTLTVVQQCEQALAPVQAFQRMRPVPDGKGGFRAEAEDVPLSRVDEDARRRDALPTELPASDGAYKLTDVYHGKISVETFVSQLSDEQLCQIVRGEGMGSPRVTAGTASAFGGITDSLSGLGIPAACCSDGPSGMRLDCGTKAFSLPNGTMLAATFNMQLMTQLYYLVGLEMTANGVDCLLGPGMNIHRHPLNGRNFEYFSEDPYLTGMIASAELAGLHKAGVEGTVKHCCGNNQETNRHFLDSVVSERALREIYLKGFETAVRIGGGKSIMTTYGAVNGLWTAAHYDLCTQIIRKEWGYDGFLMTDWWANLNERGCAPDKRCFAAMVRAQNDVYMVCADCTDHDDDLASALSAGKLTRAELQRCALNICRFLLHTNAMKRLAGEANAVTVINRPAEDIGSDEPVIFHDLEGDLTIPLDHISTERGTTFAFALNVLRPGWYSASLTASSEAGSLAQMPVTLFSMGTASGTFTWNGTDGKPVTFSNQLPLFSRYTAMRLYFAQSGLKMHSITFTLITDQINPSELIAED